MSLMRVVVFLLLLGVFGFGCGSEKQARELAEDHPIHFSVDFTESVSRVSELTDREGYRVIAVSEMEDLYRDFYKQFGFAPSHPIHIIISETVNGVKNVANTGTSYNPDTGEIVSIQMHFPYEMFEKPSVRAHELTHAFIAPFFLPTWADEGFAVLMETQYAKYPNHPVFDSLVSSIRTDEMGINAVQNWREFQGIYADGNLTQWCYRYSHTLVDHIERTYPGTFAKVFTEGSPANTFETKAFIKTLDRLVLDTDMVAFFKELDFKL